jgi:hypothetical protein
MGNGFAVCIDETLLCQLFVLIERIDDAVVWVICGVHSCRSGGEGCAAEEKRELFRMSHEKLTSLMLLAEINRLQIVYLFGEGM